jgi:hypothetical protein
LLLGGKTGITYISLKIDIYETKHNRLIWSIIHSGQISYPQYKDFIFLTLQLENPLSPEGLIINTLAQDIAIAIKDWTYRKNLLIKKQKGAAFNDRNF